MGQFLRSYFGGLFGRITAAAVLAYLAAVGFGPAWMAQMLTSWLSDPLSASLVVVRLVAIVLGITIVTVWLLSIFLSSRLRVDFDKTRDIIRNVSLFDVVTHKILPDKGTYVHVRAHCMRGAELTNCTGSIARLEKLDQNDKPIAVLEETRQLVWAPREEGLTTLTIHSGAPRDLDVFMTIENQNRLRPLSKGNPMLWEEFFSEPGRYRLTANVNGGGYARTIKLKVGWRGGSDDFDVALDGS
jgi:hypothetical protein